ncbi:MAG: prephenate dehydratase [Geoglossum simile]|nr:MAG: prephenate dehydratase [Geoglossum simile]
MLQHLSISVLSSTASKAKPPFKVTWLFSSFIRLKLLLLQPKLTLDHATDIFEAVRSSVVTRGVVPFENSTNGSVVHTLDLFCDRQSEYLDIYVCGEVYVDVHHNLLGRTASHSSNSSHKPTTPQSPRDLEPRGQFSHIRHIYSHPQAFGQCEVFLTGHLKHSKRHEVSSTSRAAEVASLDDTGTSAAISSAVAAEEYGLDILAPGIEDRLDNTTRFLVIRKGNKRSESPTGGPIAQTLRYGNERGGVTTSEGAQGHKSLVSFTIDHQSAGALADALLVFKANGLNLTSINSRPTQALPWHYIFFVEFEGSEWDDPNGAVRKALEDLREKSLVWRWFGSWGDQSK